MADLAQLHEELAQQKNDLAECEEILTDLPDFQDALDMKAAALAKISELETKITKLKLAAAPSPQPPPQSPAPPAEKWSKENHPAYRKAALSTANRAPSEEKHKPFKINDVVVARYSADKGYYPATIISLTGSSSDPIYTVKFKGYSGTEAVRAQHVRPFSNPSSSGTKRTSDGAAIATAQPSQPRPAGIPATFAGSTISAAADIDPALAQAAKKQSAPVLDGPERPARPSKKARTNQALAKAQTSWKDFQKKSVGNKVGKALTKESMFRTGEGDKAKVGFIGSGKTMSQDGGRAKHVYDERQLNID